MLANANRNPFLVAAVALAISSATVAPGAMAGSPASLAGRVLSPDGFTPRAGVQVGLLDGAGALLARSLPTRADGAFRIESAPAGRFALMVEAPEGAFVSDARVDLVSGANPPLALSLQDRTMHHYEHATGFGAENPEQAGWVQWVIAGGIGLAALLVIADQVEDEDETAASPF